MPRQIVKKKATTGATTSLLVQMMNDMNGKLKHIHKDVEKNSKDIEKMKQEIAFGRGGIRVLVFISGLVVAVLGYFNWDG